MQHESGYYALVLKTVLITLTMCATGCSAQWGGEHRTTIHTANIATASVAAVGMALDWCGTRYAATHRHDAWEGGMPTASIIGASPSPRTVDAYFAVSTVVLAAAVQLVPERYRWIAYGAVAGVEVVTVRGNLSTTRCGPLGLPESSAAARR